MLRKSLIRFLSCFFSPFFLFRGDVHPQSARCQATHGAAKLDSEASGAGEFHRVWICFFFKLRQKNLKSDWGGT